jgi:hypothetical protein
VEKIKRPSFQFYPADWRKDPALSVCSLAAKGLWVDLICIAHESETYGCLAINGSPMSDIQIARAVGEQPKVITKLLAELEQAGVFSRNDGGAIYSRRMVRDEHIRNVRGQAGRLGGNPNLVGNKVSNLDKQTDKQNPTPSSSSSSSKAACIDQVQTSTPAAQKPSTRGMQIIALLRRANIKVRDDDSNVRKWESDDTTDDQLTAAIRKARQRRSEALSDQPISTGFIAALLSNDESKRSSNEKDILERGKAVGISPRPGESWSQLEKRINEVRP